MNKTKFSLVIIALVAVFAFFPANIATAQTTDTMSEDEKYKDDKHKGKSCPSKEGKTISHNTISTYLLPHLIFVSILR